MPTTQLRSSFIKDEVVLLKDSLYQHSVGIVNPEPIKAIIREVHRYNLYRISDLNTPYASRLVHISRLTKLLEPALFSFNALLNHCNGISNDSSTN